MVLKVDASTKVTILILTRLSLSSLVVLYLGVGVDTLPSFSGSFQFAPKLVFVGGVTLRRQGLVFLDLTLTLDRCDTDTSRSRGPGTPHRGIRPMANRKTEKYRTKTDKTPHRTRSCNVR